MSIALKLTWILLFIALVLFISFLKDKKAKNKKIVFFGDSITQAGAQPGGYIALMRDMLYHQGIHNIDLVGAGIGGNKVYDLYLRMLKDVIAQSPDIVVIWIGINDVWHKLTHNTGTDIEKFEKFYRAIIHELQAQTIKVMLITPSVIGEKNDHTNGQDDELDEYVEIVRRIAKSADVALCDMHSLFHLYETNNNVHNAYQGILTTDGVHLNEAGNKFAAKEIWNVLKDIC